MAFLLEVNIAAMSAGQVVHDPCWVEIQIGFSNLKKYKVQRNIDILGILETILLESDFDDTLLWMNFQASIVTPVTFIHIIYSLCFVSLSLVTIPYPNNSDLKFSNFDRLNHWLRSSSL